MAEINEYVFQHVEGTFYKCEQNDCLIYYASVKNDERLSFSQTWEDDKGSYYFFSEDIKDFGMVTSFLTSIKKGIKIAWIHNVGERYSQWEVEYLLAEKNRDIWYTKRGKSFFVHGIIVTIYGGVSVTIDQDNFCLTGDEQALSFHIGGTSLKSIGTVKICLGKGSLLFQSNTLNNKFENINAGIKYFIPTEDKQGGQIYASISNPIFPDLLNVPLSATVTPFFWLNKEFTNLKFTDFANYATSNLITSYGNNLSLKPQAGAIFVFAIAPDYKRDSKLFSHYLTIDGEFLIADYSQSTGENNQARLMCGLSGVEFIDIHNGDSINFISGNPSCANPNGGDLFTTKGTTAWVSIKSNPDYYTYAKQDPMFSLNETSQPFLPLYERPMINIAQDIALPIMIYHGLFQGDGSEIHSLEERFLSPRRRQVLGIEQNLMTYQQREKLEYAITPNGIIIADSGKSVNQWDRLILGVNSNLQLSVTDSSFKSTSTEPEIAFTQVSNRLRNSFLANEMFMVISNSDEFMKLASVYYSLTQEDYALMKLKEGDVEVVAAIDEIYTYFKNHSFLDNLFETEQLFNAALKSASTQATSAVIEIIDTYCGKLKINIAGWGFQISPRTWKQHGTILLFKYSDSSSVEEYIEDTRRWAFDEGEDTQHTQIKLLQIIKKIKDEAEDESSPYKQISKIITDKNWKGFLAFQVPITVEELPNSLRCIMAGIDTDKFCAHHVGISVNNIKKERGTVTIERSSMFGLIHYEDLEDQVYTDRLYAFKTQYLMVLFSNSKIMEFNCKSQFMMNELFGGFSTRINAESGNNINLIGSCQQSKGNGQEDIPVYQFSLAEYATFQLDSLPIETITIQAASLSYVGIKNSLGKLCLSGLMRFRQQSDFDPFSFGQVTVPQPDGSTVIEKDGYLYFDNLAIDMTLQNDEPKFKILYENMQFDLTKSAYREKSMVASFPLKLKNFIYNEVDLPEKNSFITVGTPLQQEKIEAPWYGLLWEIDLGNLGQLAKKMDMRLQFLTAWRTPGSSDTSEDSKTNTVNGLNLGLHDTAPFLYFGIKFPSSSKLPTLPLQGIMSLGFKSIQFCADYDEDGELLYYIRMRNFALRLLGMPFPPGNNDIYLFGNPNQRSNTKLAWYAAYALHDEKKIEK